MVSLVVNRYLKSRVEGMLQTPDEQISFTAYPAEDSIVPESPSVFMTHDIKVYLEGYRAGAKDTAKFLSTQGDPK